MTIRALIPITVPNDKRRYFIPYEDLDHKEESFCRKYGFDAVPEGTIFKTDIDIKKLYEDAQKRFHNDMIEEAKINKFFLDLEDQEPMSDEERDQKIEAFRQTLKG